MKSFGIGVLVSLALLPGCSPRGDRLRVAEVVPSQAPARKIHRLSVIVDNRAISFRSPRRGPKHEEEYSQLLVTAMTDALGSQGLEVVARSFSPQSAHAETSPIDVAAFVPDGVLTLTLRNVDGDFTNMFGVIIDAFDYEGQLQEAEGKLLWRAQIHAPVGGGRQKWRRKSMEQLAASIVESLRQEHLIRSP